ncbi:unnamed protein product [Peronospora effusa]|nr:unnamed protein product [Peronospora effusa]
MYDENSMENIRCKRLREETDWNAEASHELLRLRFQQLRDLFDDAQTVADVHEAWGVVASTLSKKTDYRLQVDAVQCSDQLTKLRKQWQQSSKNQLHVMMAECFNKNIVESQQQHESMQHLPQIKSNFNKAMEEALMQEAEEEKTVDSGLKRSKTVAVQEVEEVSVSSLSDQAATLSSSEPILMLSELTCLTKHDMESSTVGVHEDRLLPAPESLEISPQPVSSLLQETLLSVVLDEEKEFHRHGDIMRALEKRSQQFERLAQSHKHLANVTEQLMDALVNRNIDLT